MNVFRMIPMDKLFRRSDVRREDFEASASLASSIAKIGLTNPITVRAMPNGGFEIIAGSHRYAACDSLDHREIMCQVVELDDLHATLAMIDENLCRAELSPSDRAAQTARRKAIYEELHPETQHGGDRKRDQVAKLSTCSFAEATAEATGRDARSVRRDAERGQKVIDEVLDMIRGTKLDTGAYLDRIKDLPPNDQVDAAKRDLLLMRKRDREEQQHAFGPKREKTSSVASNSNAATDAGSPANADSSAKDAFAIFIELADRLDAIEVRDILEAAGKRRSVLCQRALGVADMMEDISKGCTP